ncbi:MAG TPA: DUF998 domain-containing protein [Terriglobales bacterium]|nr:DUF998 domain-containing protein [Terriglobales bacterium]
MLQQNIYKSVSRNTGALLACGFLAGPLYIAVTAIQAVTREGFDPRIHRYNLLTTGDLGWIHQANYIIAGVLMVLFAVGVRRMLPRDLGGLWGSRLFVLYGIAYISSGVFPADPVIGFPPGTLSHTTTWHGLLQMASRSLSSIALVAASLVIARWFAAHGLRKWVWFSWVAVPISLAAFALVAIAGADTSTKNLAFLVPGIAMWVWVTAIAFHLYRRTERHDTAPERVRWNLQPGQ